MKNKKIIITLGCLLILSVFGGINLVINKRIKGAEIYFRENELITEELEGVFTKFPKSKTEKTIAVVSSHHLLAKDLIAETFSKIENNQINKVIIVSPNHYKQIKEPKCLVMTANVGWESKTGVIKPESITITRLIKKENWCQDINSFRGEHGITALVPFIRNYFPGANIIPIILKQNNNLIFFNNLGQKMAKEIDKDKTLLVISSDFCHNIPKNKTEIDDLVSLKILENKEIDKINLINNDCHECIAFLFGYLGKKNNFKLVGNSNSFEISGEYPESVTSYINGYYQ